ncbi:MAG: endonuclease [Bacteroidales bacterium]|nr:endonuclease [Candidatus Colimorpha onthohippi]
MACSPVAVLAQQRVAFWNVENYFDTDNDSLTADDEFTPDGTHRWTWSRFVKKRDNIARTIIAMGAPCVVGMAEVENDKVLEELTKGSPLRKLNYRYVHYESPDPRGIDCALIYIADSACLIESRPISTIDTNLGNATRDILLVGLRMYSGDTLYIFVNHWPSKLGGRFATSHRHLLARQLWQQMDSVGNAHPNAIVMAMGDFNATFNEIASMQTSHTPISLMDSSVRGSYCYHGYWQCIDLMITLNTQLKLQTYVFDADFLLTSDGKYMQDKPYRTYLGPRYIGGISDHLPIYCDTSKR